MGIRLEYGILTERGKNMVLKCKLCGKKPCEISEYRSGAFSDGITADEYVIKEEGTLNKNTGKFYCTSCYVKLGMPSGIA